MESTFPIYGITVNQLKKLGSECEISSVAELLEKGRTPEKRQEIADKIDVDRKSVDLWVKQADLLRVEGMTSEYAYFLVHAGIRSIEDLAKINVNTTKNALQAAVNAHPFLEYEVEDNGNMKLSDPPVSPRISYWKGDVSVSAEFNQEYLLSETGEIPQNWRDAKSLTDEQSTYLSLGKIDNKDIIYVYTRFKSGTDNLISYNYFVTGNADSMFLNPKSIRMRVGEIKRIDCIDVSSSWSGLCYKNNNYCIELYKDELCTKPIISPVDESCGENALVYVKAVKPTPCDYFTINGFKCFYQIIDNSAYETITYTEAAPEITDTDLMIMKNNAIKLNPSSLIMNNLGLIYQDLPQEIIEALKDKVRDVNIDVSDEIEPSYLFDYDYILEVLDKRSESEIINEGLTSLREINISLPLPKYFCCKVSYRNKDEAHVRKSTQVSGLQVEVSGIVSPGSDEDFVLKAYTDSSGQFIITLPEKYSFKDCVTFTISNDTNKQIFNINASDIIRDSVINNIHDNSLSTSEIIEYLEEIDDINNELSQYNNQLDIVNIILNVMKAQKSILEREKEIEDELNKDDISDLEKDQLTNQLEYFKNDYLKKDALIKQLQGKLDTTETDINKIKQELDTNIKKLKIKRKTCIIKVFVEDPTRNENEKTLSYLLSLMDMAWKYGINDGTDGFVIIEEIFKNYRDDYAKALPSVKLMGEDEGAIWLPTDRAPSRIYSYSLLQRLVEPTVDPPAGKTIDIVTNDGEGLQKTADQRRKLEQPVDITEFKMKFSKNTSEYPKMSSLGIGYCLNMHQAWVPEGFALGELLYSLILAPGEEQRIVVREKSQDYTIEDTNSGEDSTSQYMNRYQTDNVQALYDYVLNQELDGNTDTNFNTSTISFGASIGAGGGGVTGGLTGGYSRTKGKSSTHTKQSNSHNEATQASQAFNQKFSVAASLLAKANRVSVRTASSNESDSTAVKVVANHNHSHSMTVQYWEVVRRYRLETSIDGIDLVLFVPFNPICFLPDNTDIIDTDTFALDYENLYKNSNPNDPTKTNVDFVTIKKNFNNRYKKIMLYYSILYNVIPYKYRNGLELIQKYYNLPFFHIDDFSFDETQKQYTLNIIGNFCDFDKLSATIYFNNTSISVNGLVTMPKLNELTLDGTTKPHNRMEVIQAINRARNNPDIDYNDANDSNSENSATITFNLPNGCSEGNISRIVISNKIKNEWKYALCQDENLLTTSEKAAIKNYEQWLLNKYGDTTDFKGDQNKINEFFNGLPEWYTNPIATFNNSELRSLGTLNISVYTGSEKWEFLIKNNPIGTGSVTYTFDNIRPKLSIQEVQKMEETFQHIVSENLRYSKAIWQSLTTDELIMMLEQYTIDMEFNDYFDVNKNAPLQIPLLNCINVKKPLGFYGNCILFPFTYPESLSLKLGKSAAEIQDSLYRYHASNFRSPSTVISVPTEGMIGEAVLGSTNVSEKIDITRFWNWQDSPIDHVTIDKDYIDNNDYLAEKNTSSISNLNLQKPDNYTAASTPDILKSLIERTTPSFNDITGAEYLTNLMQSVVEKNSESLSSTAEKSSTIVDKIMEYKSNQIEKQADLEKAKAEAEKAKLELEIAKSEADKAESEAKKVKSEADKAASEAEKVKYELELAKLKQ